ncbi:MAG: hypothetical protein FWF30_02520, partial [Coriobacteriia bacterium]|nr:hypothetical protein [Coriobacteriia bacterium]
MTTKTQHPSIKRATLQAIDGGWVSYVDPHVYPKASFGETKPYFAPESLTDLHGPDSGVIRLPHSIYWGPDRWFNLAHRSSLHLVYQMVLQEGSIEDIDTYLDQTTLLSIWNELSLPPRLSDLWQRKVCGMR